MNGRLTKQSKMYLSILYVLWELLSYYADMFRMDVPQDATGLSAEISTDEDDATHILLDVPCISPPSSFRGMSVMKESFNEYLNIALLPQSSELKPFAPPDIRSYADLTDCIYIYKVAFLDSGHYFMDIIHVDSMPAYQKVRASQNIKK